MGSEIEITETPNWLKELEAKRERRLRTKLGHELGAGAPCLTCEEKCPGLDLHFWRKICKNCKCSKESHEVQDDDIYGWAQDELLGTKVNRLKRKIVLPGRKDEVELEWTPNGQKETIDKYLKAVPLEQLPIKGSQAAQDRKQLLKKQIPIHDIDPTLCHELTDEELKKMQEYVSHIKESSVGIGHLIQINFNKGKTHILDKNDAMFLINNVPKGLVSSDNVLLQEGSNSVPLEALTNKFSNLDARGKSGLGVQNPSALSTEYDKQDPIYANLRDKHYNVNDSISRNNANNLKHEQLNTYGPQVNKILTEDIQVPQDTSLRSLNYPENINDNIPGDLNESSSLRDVQYPTNRLYGNSNIKNLVPSAFVPIKLPNESINDSEVHNILDRGTVKELPYPSQFINDKYKYGHNLPNYNSGRNEILEEHQNPAFFQPIKDLEYSPSPNINQSLNYPSESQVSAGNDPNYRENHLKGLNQKTQFPLTHNDDHTLKHPSDSHRSISNDPSMLNSTHRRNDVVGIGEYQGEGYSPSQHENHPLMYQHESQPAVNRPSCYPRESQTNEDHHQRYPEESQSIRNNYMSENSGSRGGYQGDNKNSGRLSQSNSPLQRWTPDSTYSNEDQQKPTKIKSIKDLAYSTYDNPPEGAPSEDFHILSVKDRLNLIKNGQLPEFRPKGSPISDTNVSPSKFSSRVRTGGEFHGDTMGRDGSLLHPTDNVGVSQHRHLGSPNLTSSRVPVKSPITQNVQSERLRQQSPSSSIQSPSKGSYETVTPKTGLDHTPHGKELFNEGPNKRYQSPSGRQINTALPSYTPGNKNTYEDDLQPRFIPIGGIRDIEFEDPEIRTALSKDNDLFEGAAPNKFIPNLNSEDLPCCHYCKEKFKQDELAIAIPERSDAIFHTECFKCHGCNQILADMFYFYDKESDNVFCGRDYAKIRGIPRCRACDELIFVKEYCLAENSTFHVKHFCCFECDKPLAGQNYVMENDQPLCVPCYELTKANKCYACKEVIHPDQQGLQLKDGVHFHATEDCFACKVCKKSLFGAKLLFRNDCLYCSHDCYNSDA